MRIDNVMTCATADWSFLATAPSLSQLAGVLAGFLFTAVVLLLSRPLVAARQAQALGLFLAAFVTLAMDSYLFASLSGDSEAADLCLRSRSSGLIASGILGVGGMAIMAGICWLLAASVTLDSAPRRTQFWRQAEVEQRDLDDEVRRLGIFAEVMMYATAAAIASFVVLTGVDYAYYGLHTSKVALLYGGAAAYLVLLAGLLYGSWAVKRKRTAPGRATVTAAIMSTVGYSVVGAVVTTVIMAPFGGYWAEPSRWVVLAITGFALLGGLPAMITLAHVVPSRRTLTKHRTP
ncbi:hypothetical protein EV645_6608 [Kribbella rubisoli]|uniref:Uncharacterized protein n=1 Tax=Kribbella rubisoli TaxID=3075929 RepID=A0A4Q7WK71_9ACTN|nr:hypothetical protein [Kribbella rubisoli]RZU10148.1 hypothetical protein EV645_6608 [Kribbella rubisoli]